MADLTGQDVEDFTQGRLDGSDDEVRDMLKAALQVARRDAGWHVCPVRSGDDAEEVILDGPDSRILTLPTRKLIDLVSVDEDGVELDLADLSWSAGGPPGLLNSPVRVRKRGRKWWSAEYQAITVVMEHGYTEDEAADWRRAVLQMVDQMSLVPVAATSFGPVSPAGVRSKRIDDVAETYGGPFAVVAEEVLFSMEHIFCDYRLPRLEFL